jgi:dynactin complex subunit
MVKINKQIQALKTASQRKRQNTLDKVNDTLQKMRDNNLPINFGSVAKLSGVSKTWLYNQAELKSQINSTRGKTGKIQRVIDQQSLVERKEAEIIALKNKNNKLKETIKKLRHQLEIIYGELYKLKHQSTE